MTRAPSKVGIALGRSIATLAALGALAGTGCFALPLGSMLVGSDPGPMDSGEDSGEPACSRSAATGACGVGGSGSSGGVGSEAGTSEDGGALDDANVGALDGASVDGGACSSDVPSGGACNTIVDVGTAVAPTCATGALPTGTGGAIVDGTYVLTSQTYYDGACPSVPISATLVGAGDCLQISATLYEGAGVPYTFSAVRSVQGNQYAATLTCPIASACPSQTLTFTATASELTLFEPASACGPAIAWGFALQ
jgi:hypothetical protein